MSLLNHALALGRRSALALQTDTVKIGLFTDGTNETTGDPIRVPVSERYSGRARVRLSAQNVTNAQGPSMPVAVQEPTLSIPWGSPRVFVGDEVLVTGSGDPILVGRRFRVQGNAQAGQTTAHRYSLQEIS